MHNERVIELLNRVEHNAGAIYVRECIDGEWRNLSLIELPTHLAIKHTCRIVRSVLRHEQARVTVVANNA